jgi:hypothetical protein
VIHTVKPVRGPVEARAEVVHELPAARSAPHPIHTTSAAHGNALAGVLLADRARKAARLVQVGILGLEPEEIRVRRERKRAAERCTQAARVVVVALARARVCPRRQRASTRGKRGAARSQSQATGRPSTRCAAARASAFDLPAAAAT